jgi:hypothetical protein
MVTIGKQVMSTQNKYSSPLGKFRQTTAQPHLSPWLLYGKLLRIEATGLCLLISATDRVKSSFMMFFASR